MESKILIGAPLSNEEANLPDYLNCISNLNYPKNNITLAWFINNSNDSTLSILQEFIRKNYELYSHIYLAFDPIKLENKFTSKRNFAYRFGMTGDKPGTCEIMAMGKNWLKTCISDENHVLYIEGDIFISPDCIVELLKEGKDIVGALCRTGISAFNFMDRDGDGWTRTPGWYPEGTVQVDYICGPVLYKSEIFKKLPFTQTRGVGEDAEAMNWCAKNGIERWLCSRVKLQHDRWKW